MCSVGAQTAGRRVACLGDRRGVPETVAWERSLQVRAFRKRGWCEGRIRAGNSVRVRGAQTACRAGAEGMRRGEHMAGKKTQIPA